MTPERWRRARRVLAVRLDNLGDVLVTTPALHAIKDSLPSAELTLLASPVGAQVGRRPLVVVHPGCSMPARTYPWELYAEVVDLLVSRLGATVVLTGTPDERELVGRIGARLRPGTREAVLSLAGQLPFAAFCALVAAADLKVTNN